MRQLKIDLTAVVPGSLLIAAGATWIWGVGIGLIILGVCLILMGMFCGY